MKRYKELNTSFPNSIRIFDKLSFNFDTSDFILRNNEVILKEGNLTDLIKEPGKVNLFIQDKKLSVLYKWNSLYKYWIQEYI